MRWVFQAESFEYWIDTESLSGFVIATSLFECAIFRKFYIWISETSLDESYKEPHPLGGILMYLLVPGFLILLILTWS